MALFTLYLCFIIYITLNKILNVDMLEAKQSNYRDKYMMLNDELWVLDAENHVINTYAKNGDYVNEITFPNFILFPRANCRSRLMM